VVWCPGSFQTSTYPEKAFVSYGRVCVTSRVHATLQKVWYLTFQLVVCVVVRWFKKSGKRYQKLILRSPAAEIAFWPTRVPDGRNLDI
jgi:hypothetical protein